MFLYIDVDTVFAFAYVFVLDTSKCQKNKYRTFVLRSSLS